MEERQVTMGDRTLALPDPFFVLATQNPIEHEGTFRLPEAQLDRFMLKLLVDYPTAEEELGVVLKYGRQPEAGAPAAPPPPTVSASDLQAIKRALHGVRIEKELAAYAVAIIRAARPPVSANGGSDARPQAVRELDRYIEYGPSPRGSLALYRAACSLALLDGRDFVLPDDVKKAAPAVLRHRILPSYEAEADRVGSDSIVRALLAAVPVP
jgi:MoxR-like ATPase